MPNEIHQAINEIMQEVGYVRKSKSGGLTYSFAGEAALIAALRPSMVEHGVYMHILKIESTTRDTYTTKNGAVMNTTFISAVVRFSHVSGSFIDVSSVGEGADSGDKSASKAMTGLYKYAMRQTFCIETGDDPDNFASVERKPAAAMTYEQAEKVTTQRGTLLTALTVEQLNTVIKETHDANISEAAKIVLANKEAK